MAYGTVRQNYETVMFTEAASIDAVLAALNDTSFKSSEGQLSYPPAEGVNNYTVHVIIEPMI